MGPLACDGLGTFTSPRWTEFHTRLRTVAEVASYQRDFLWEFYYHRRLVIDTKTGRSVHTLSTQAFNEAVRNAQ